VTEPASRRRRTSQLDEVDRAILHALSVDARARNRTLAAELGLSEATIAVRIRALESRRVLGVSVVFDWVAAGFAVDLRLYVSVEGRPVSQVASDLAATRHVRWVMLVFGSCDIVLHVQVPDRGPSLEAVLDAVGAVPGVRATRCEVSLETLKYQVEFARVPVAASELHFPSPVVELDDLDLAIIESLLQRGRQSNRAIARHLGASDGTVRSRLRRLEEAGLLRVCALTDPYRTGHVSAWAYIGIDVTGSELHRVAAALAALPEVLILTVSAGRFPLVALVVAEHRRALTELAITRLRSIEGVRHTETSEIVRTAKLDYRWVRLLPTDGGSARIGPVTSH
jgi:DNA-binding Lrp family transcriptional regulator